MTDREQIIQEFKERLESLREFNKRLYKITGHYISDEIHQLDTTYHDLLPIPIEEFFDGFDETELQVLYKNLKR